MRIALLLAFLAGCSSESTRDTVRVRVVLPAEGEDGTPFLFEIDRFEVWKRGVGRVGGASGGAAEFRIYADDTADLAVKAFDAAGKLVACGQSPPVPSEDGAIAIYVAPPLSVTPSPGKRSAARSRAGAAAVTKGLILVGGGDVNGAFDVIDLYSVYTHEVTSAALGYARRDVSVAVEPADGGDRVWVFGGFGPSMAAPLAHFDLAADGTIGTTVVDGDFPGLETPGRSAFAIAPGEWIIPESPPRLLRGGTVVPRQDLVMLYDRAAQSPTVHRAAFDAGAFDLAVIEGDSVKHVTLPRVMDTVVGLTRGRFLAIHDGRDGFIVDPDAGTLVDKPGLRSAGVDLYTDAVGTNGRQVVIVDTGGAEVFDAETLERFDDVLALGNYQRIGVRLPNDQIAFIDEGRDTIHLFTPPPPEWADSVAKAGVRN